MQYKCKTKHSFILLWIYPLTRSINFHGTYLGYQITIIIPVANARKFISNIEINTTRPPADLSKLIYGNLPDCNLTTKYINGSNFTCYILCKCAILYQATYIENLLSQTIFQISKHLNDLVMKWCIFTFILFYYKYYQKLHCERSHSYP